MDYSWQEQEQGQPVREEKRAGEGKDPCRILKEGGIVIGMSRSGKKEKISRMTPIRSP